MKHILRNGKSISLSTDSIGGCVKHLCRALMPTFICVILCVILGLVFGDTQIVIASPQFALSNSSNFISLLLGFLFTFVGITLGFSSSRGVQIIFEHPAPKFQYWVNIITPTCIGAFALLYITLVGGLLQGTSITISGWKISIFSAVVIDFILSFVNTIWLFTKVIAIAMQNSKENTPKKS